MCAAEMICKLQSLNEFSDGVIGRRPVNVIYRGQDETRVNALFCF